MSIINEFIAPCWDSLDKIQKIYNEETKTKTAAYDNVVKAVARIYSLRWRILAGFAKVTKKRLETVRLKIEPSKRSQTRKKDVTLDMLSTLLTERVRREELFLSELRTMCKKDYEDLIVQYAISKGIPSSKARAYLLSSCTKVYAKELRTPINNDLMEPTEPLSDSLKLFLKSHKILKSVFMNIRHLKTKSFKLVWEHKGWSYKILDDIIQRSKSLSAGLNEIRGIDINVYENIMRIYAYGGEITKDNLCEYISSLSKICSRGEINDYTKRETETPTNKQWLSVKSRAIPLTEKITSLETEIYLVEA